MVDRNLKGSPVNSEEYVQEANEEGVKFIF